MNNRDLKADFELCKKYKDNIGPWLSKDGLPTKHLVGAAAFLNQAREGWPHAIERAIKAETLVLELREALNKIAYPVRYLQNEADEKNFSLDGRAAAELANSSHWLKSIAKEVLGDE